MHVLSVTSSVTFFPLCQSACPRRPTMSASQHSTHSTHTHTAHTHTYTPHTHTHTHTHTHSGTRGSSASWQSKCVEQTDTFSKLHTPPAAGNAGAILVLGRDLVMVPKLIHPLPPSTPRTPDSNGAIDEDLPGGTNHVGGGADTWMQVGNHVEI